MPKPALKKDFWDELDKLVAPPVLEPPKDSFTIEDFCSRRNQGVVQSRKKLNDLIKEGKLLVTKVKLGQYSKNYYHLPK